MKDNKIYGDIKEAVLKKAIGFDTSETIEEYQSENGSMVLTKKKVTKKYVPPDTQAAKLLMDMNTETDIKALSDGELEKEKIRLLKILKEIENETEQN